jgi:hypothetical protein
MPRQVRPPRQAWGPEVPEAWGAMAMVREGVWSAHHANLKKVGLSTAYFKRTAVTESSMPTPRAKAAFRYFLANNKYYRKYWEMQKELLENDRILTISSFDLFINYTGIECAMYEGRF